MTPFLRLATLAALLPISAIATLLLLFLGTVDRASDYFSRVSLSQSQFADLLAVRAAARAGDGAALDAALARYWAAVEAELPVLGRAERADQHRERIDASEMASLATARPPRLEALARVIDAAAAREQAEARDTVAEMAALRARSRHYALLLAVVAAAAAMVGAVGLGLANRRLSRAVDDRTARLVAVDASRRLFFAKVSHELRTPVTVMRGEAEVALATARQADELGAALLEVVAQSEQLDRRIGELLALSQAEDGRPSLDRLPVDLASVVAGAVARSGRYAAVNGVALALDPPPAVPIVGDARWLEQALVAVIDNAVKFSKSGGTIDVGLSVRDGAARVSVADRGVGVLPTALPRLFDAYYQADEGRARGGSGLGLALVRWIAEQHGGIADAAARDGGGCVVSLRLPIAA